LFSHRIRPSFVTNIVHNKFNGFIITNGTNKRIDDDSDDNGRTICDSPGITWVYIMPMSDTLLNVAENTYGCQLSY